MIKEEKEKILKAMVEERNYYVKGRERRLAEEQGKIAGADYMMQMLIGVLKSKEDNERSEETE